MNSIQMKDFVTIIEKLTTKIAELDANLTTTMAINAVLVQVLARKELLTPEDSAKLMPLLHKIAIQFMDNLHAEVTKN